METKREYILRMVEEMVSDLLYYDRKNDENCPVGYIESAFIDEELTIDEFVDCFKEELERCVFGEVGEEDE